MKKILVAASMMLFGMMSVQAANNYTPAGTAIENNATLTYSAGGVDQPEVNATISAGQTSADVFVVDNKIDLIVTHQDPTAVAVVPGAQDQVLTFVVRNDGNKVQDYKLTSTANDGNPYAGINDTFDTDNVRIFVDKNNNGVYDPGTDDQTYIDELAPDANVTVFIVSNIPIAQQNGDAAEYSLTAQVAEGGTAATQGADITNDDRNNADDAMTEQIVFADGDGNGATEGDKDGQFADHSAYQIQAPQLILEKESCVLSDPINITTNPKRIPGATIRYMFDIENDGSVDATNVTLKDLLNDALDIATLANVITNEHQDDGQCVCATNAANGAAPGHSENGQEVTLTGVNVSSAAHERHTCVSFEVEIK